MLAAATSPWAAANTPALGSAPMALGMLVQSPTA